MYRVKIVISHKNDAFVTKKVSTHLTKIFTAIFALAERLPTFATLKTTYFSQQHIMWIKDQLADHLVLFVITRLSLYSS